MRAFLAALAGLVLVTAAGSAPVPEEKESKEEVARKIRALVPEAASSRNKDWKRIGQNPPLEKIEEVENQSLSMVFLFLPPPGEKDPAWKDFHLPEGVGPHKLAEALSRGSLLRGYGTMLQPDYITEVTCELKGKMAMGVVAFHAPKLYQGRVQYTARLGEKGWRIEEFRLPGYKVKISRKGDGPWKQGPLAGKE